jgi:hypothetical protein
LSTSRQTYATPFALYPIQPSSATLQNAPGVIVPEWVGGPCGGGGGAASVVGIAAGVVTAATGLGDCDGDCDGDGDGDGDCDGNGDGDGEVTSTGAAGAGDVGLALSEPPTTAAIAPPAQHSTRKAAMTLRMIGSVRLLARAVTAYGEGGTGAVPDG